MDKPRVTGSEPDEQAPHAASERIVTTEMLGVTEGGEASPVLAAGSGEAETPKTEAPLGEAGQERGSARPAHGGAPSSPPPTVDRRSGRAGALLGAALLGGVAGFLGAAVASRVLPVTDRQAAGRLSVLEQQVKDVSARPNPVDAAGQDFARVGEIERRLGVVESTLGTSRAGAQRDPQSPLADLPSALAALKAEIAGLRTADDGLRASLRVLTTRADAAERGAEATKTVLASVGAAAAKRTDLDTLVSRVAAMEAGVNSMQEEVSRRVARPADRQARIAILAISLREAVERGAPYAAELGTLRAVGTESPAALARFASSGVPTVPALAREFSDLTSALAQSDPETSERSGLVDRLQSRAGQLVRIRPINAAPATDAASGFSRVQRALDAGDVRAAVADAQSLPEAARLNIAPWLDRARGRLDAIEQASALTTASFADLGGSVR